MIAIDRSEFQAQLLNARCPTPRIDSTEQAVKEFELFVGIDDQPVGPGNLWGNSRQMLGASHAG
jgi:hypothetical protein